MTKEERIQYLRNLISESPTDPFPSYALILETGPDSPDFGLESWLNFQIQFPDYLPQYFQSGMAALKMNQKERALSIWKEGIQLAEKQSNAHTLAELKSVWLNAQLDEDE